MKIKPIEWEVKNNDPRWVLAPIDYDGWPLPIFGQVIKKHTQWEWLVEDGERWYVEGTANSLDDAKQQCQAAYESVIREIIDTHTEQEAQ